jgi:DNA-directed RNA polymerase, subunit H, RpoH/RPB5
MTKKDAQKVIEEFNCKPTELPLIFVTYHAIHGLGAKPGDLIRITRKSGTGGESTYYRYVVET